jgi:hypothetical protein
MSTRIMRRSGNVLVEKPEINRPLGRPSLRWEGNIRVDLKEIGWESMERTDLAEDRDDKQNVAYMVIKLWVP